MKKQPLKVLVLIDEKSSSLGENNVSLVEQFRGVIEKAISAGRMNEDDIDFCFADVVLNQGCHDCGFIIISSQEENDKELTKKIKSMVLANSNSTIIILFGGNMREYPTFSEYLKKVNQNKARVYCRGFIYEVVGLPISMLYLRE